MLGLPIFFLLIVVGAIVLGVRFLARRKSETASGDQDLIAYGLLAIAVGTTVFAVTQLGQAAFPGERVAGDPGQQVATALAALVVGAPIAFLLWRRQAQRRKLYPDSSGWPVYLAFAEAVFTTALLVTSFQLIVWLFGNEPRSSWTDVVILAGVFVFHEWASRQDPPGSEIAELPRVTGSVIGLIAASIGVGGVLWNLFEYLYGTIFATAGNLDLSEPIVLVALGAPLWAYRWLRPWPGAAAVPRKTWLVATSTISLSTAIGSMMAMAVVAITFILGDVGSAAEHFELVPGALAVLAVALGVWRHHQQRIGTERDNTLRTYEYIMAALGLAFAVGGLTALVTVALGDEALVGDSRPEVILSLAILTLTAVAVWLWFWNKCQSADRAAESVSPPRRIYVLGMAIVAGLAAAQALIATLVVLFQFAFGLDPSQRTLVTEGALAVFATLTTLHLVRVNKADRALIETSEVILPFTVTIVCSHPGKLAALFPKEATTRVIYRADEAAIVTEEMAEAIVAAVATTSSIVWVSDTGFEVAPARDSH